MREPLAKACQIGGTSLYINGVDPGFSGDSLVYTALTLAGRATAVTVSEICDYGSYDDAEFTGVSFGFGTTPDHTPIIFAPGVLASLWGGQVRSLADVLDVTLDEVRERHESWVTPEQIECTMMTVPPGHVAAVRFAVEGIRDGQPVITMEHVNRLTAAAAPHWPTPRTAAPYTPGSPSASRTTSAARRCPTTPTSRRPSAATRRASSPPIRCRSAAATSSSCATS